MASDFFRERLFVSIARRLDSIDAAHLARACDAWHRDPHRSLIEILLSQGAIDAATQALVDNVVTAHLAQHGGDAEACYASVLAKGWVPREIVTEPTVPPTDAAGPIFIGDGAGPDAITATVSLESVATGESRYQLRRRVGEGGQGEVYEAIDTELNREVLLKQVLAKHATTPESRGRFLRETRTGAMLEHPGIVPVYDIGQHPGGQLFQVMRYFRPGSLHKKIAAYHLANPDSLEELTFRTLLGHFATACRAIDYTHSRGIHHLDLKPTNIVTGEFGETQIIDWGLAQITDADMEDKVRESTGVLGSGFLPSDSPAEVAGAKPPSSVTLPQGFRGTPPYAAPEQWKGDWKTIGRQTDVYGLGATLFEILAGRAPFDGHSPTIREDVEIGNCQRSMKAWVPAALQAICRKAMAVRPAERYASAGALADDVDCFLADETVAAYPDPWQVRLWRFTKRHRAAVAAAAALLATSVVALGIGNVLVSQQRDRALVAEAEAVQQRGRAEDNAQATRGVIAGFIENVADDKWAAIPGTAALRLDAVRNVVEEYPLLLAQQADNPGLQYDAALIDRRCANLFRVLGVLEEAAPLYDRSRGLMKTLVERYPAVEMYRSGWSHNLLDEAEALVRTVGPEAALPTLREALENAEQTTGSFPTSNGALRTLAQVRMDLADALIDSGRIDEAKTLSGEAVRNFDAVTASDDGDDEQTRVVTRLLAAMATVVATRARAEAGSFDDAKEMMEQANRRTAELSDRHGGIPDVDFVRGLALLERARVLSRDATTAAAGGEVFLQAEEWFRGLVERSGNVANYRPAFTDLLCQRSTAALAAGNLADAVRLADEALAAITPSERPAGAAEAKRSLAMAHASRGRVAAAAGDAECALDHFRHAREYYAAAVAAAPENKPLRQEAAAIERLLAE